MRSEHEPGTAGDTEVWTLADDPEDEDPMRWPEDPDAVERSISD